MASPEELQLEQKARALKLKEEALNKQAEHQAKTEARIKEHQHNMAEKERANQQQSQSLIDREAKYKEENDLLNQERQSLLDAHQISARKRHKPFALLMPFLLFSCIVAGYFAYEQLNTKEQYFEQVSVAADNIDKLAGLLSSSQEDVLTASTELQNKQRELVRTRAMLLDLRTTADQLQLEVAVLKNPHDPIGLDQTTLAASVLTLSDQLSSLKSQLEEYYLTNDVNEAFIEYQEKDLTIVKTQHEDLLARNRALEAQNAQLALVNNQLKRQSAKP